MEAWNSHLQLQASEQSKLRQIQEIQIKEASQKLIMIDCHFLD